MESVIEGGSTEGGRFFLAEKVRKATEMGLRDGQTHLLFKICNHNCSISATMMSGPLHRIEAYSI